MTPTTQTAENIEHAHSVDHTQHAVPRPGMTATLIHDLSRALQGEGDGAGGGDGRGGILSGLGAVGCSELELGIFA